MKMYMYMATHIRQTIKRDILGNEHWEDDKASNHTFFIFAENEKEANEYADAALKKKNEYAASNERFIMGTGPKQINVMSVTHDIHVGTSVTGIWD